MSYIYYAIHKFYRRWNDSNPEIMASLVLSATIFFYLLSAFRIMLELLMVNMHIPMDYRLIVPVLLIFGLCHWRFSSKVRGSYLKWDNEEPWKMDLKGGGVVFYVLGSVAALAI